VTTRKLPTGGRGSQQRITERIYASLKASIVDFRVRPGEKLTEAQLGAGFGVSRTPVREALQRLTREGLLRTVAREGYFVRAFDLGELDKFYEVRIALEALAVELAVTAIEPAVLHELQAFWCRPPAQLQAIDADVLVLRDEAFHETIAAQSGNPLLLRFLRDINPRIRIIRRLDYTELPLIRKSFQGHAAVLSAMAVRDAGGAVAHMREHITESRNRTRALAAERLAHIYSPEHSRKSS
jgi:DNA-binding GntR family transcriptional regulator